MLAHPAPGDFARRRMGIHALELEGPPPSDGPGFLPLEDATGMIEAVLFPKTWQRFGAELTGQAAYHLRGCVESRDGAIALHADHLERLSD